MPWISRATANPARRSLFGRETAGSQVPLATINCAGGCGACPAHADANGALAYVRENGCAVLPLDHRTGGCDDGVHRERGGENAPLPREDARVHDAHLDVAKRLLSSM